jgi:hypothetical protein
MGTLPKFVFRLTDYHVIWPSFPIVPRLSLKLFLDTIFPGVPLTLVPISGRMHRLHAQEATRTRPNCQYCPQDVFRTGERLFLRMALCFTYIRAFTAGPEYFVYLNTKLLTYEVTLFLLKPERRMEKSYSSTHS